MSHVVRMTVTGSLGVTFMFLVDVANLFWVSLFGKQPFAGGFEASLIAVDCLVDYSTSPKSDPTPKC